ncbi:homoserine O-acetyltransferase/O-succinyltransferase family protein, partial [Cetobacterium sp.]|uniref:homoserine O-acetyltransferase/O-succinyltransferase family protein n=1 Tax=Cetobacterium sp. TaxID=2071632 RepID=UPI003EE762D1
MPIKQEVEYQFSTIFEDIDKNISLDYLKEKDTPLNRICEDEYDGFIVTGAPIEMYEYEKVDFWKEID